MCFRSSELCWRRGRGYRGGDMGISGVFWGWSSDWVWAGRLEWDAMTGCEAGQPYLVLCSCCRLFPLMRLPKLQKVTDLDRPCVSAGVEALGMGRPCVETPVRGRELRRDWLGLPCSIPGHIGHSEGWEWTTLPRRKCKLRGEPGGAILEGRGGERCLTGKQEGSSDSLGNSRGGKRPDLTGEL